MPSFYCYFVRLSSSSPTFISILVPRKVHLHYSTKREAAAFSCSVQSSAVHFCLGDYSLLSQPYRVCVFGLRAYTLHAARHRRCRRRRSSPTLPFGQKRKETMQTRLVRLPRTHPRKFVWWLPLSPSFCRRVAESQAYNVSFRECSWSTTAAVAANHPLQQRQPQKKEKPGAATVRMCSLCIQPDSIQSGLPCTRSVGLAGGLEENCVDTLLSE